MCQSQQTEDHRRLAREFIAALNRRDQAAIADLYADDALVWTPGRLPFSGTFNKAQAMRGVDAVLTVFPEGLRFTIKAMTAEDERVAIEAESYGRHVNGKLYNNQYHFLMIIRDGKVAVLREYMDTLHAFEVLGG